VLIPDSMFLLLPLPSLAIAASAADIRVGTRTWRATAASSTTFWRAQAIAPTRSSWCLT
jgi:hypothetical protein